MLTSTCFPITATRIAILATIPSASPATVGKANLTTVLPAPLAAGLAATLLAVLAAAPAAIRAGLFRSWWFLTEGWSLQVISDQVGVRAVQATTKHLQSLAQGL